MGTQPYDRWHMPSAKARTVRSFQKYVLNPPVRALFALGLVPPTHVLLETTGRQSGRSRQNPVGNGLDGDTLWIVPEDDPRARLDRIGRRLNGFMVRAVGTDLLTIRVDLDPEPQA